MRTHALLAIVFILNLISLAAFAEVSVQATVDRNEMEPGDTLVYTIAINMTERVNLSHPHLPQMSHFSVINEWSSESVRSAMSITPQGRREFNTIRTQNFNFQLQPKTEGLLRIGSAEVEIDGKTYTTKPITIKVVKGVNRGQQQRQVDPQQGLPQGFPSPFDEEEDIDPFAQLLRRRMLPNTGGFGSQNFNPNEAFHIQVEVDKEEVFVSEQITASWYLYTKGNIRDIDTLKYPSLRGFWKEDIELATQLNFTEEIINGVPYRKALLASFALFPIKSGVAVIDSYTAKCSVLVGDVFSGFNSKIYQFTKSSQPVKIKVKDLPVEGRPSDFSGAVGQFQVSADIGSQAVIANQPFILKIRFDGRGNAKLIDIPPFQPPEGMELYDTQKDARFFKEGTSYKEFRLSLIPRREGQFVIPPITASIFDPVSKRYVARATQAITVNVQKGQGGGLASSPLSSGDDSKIIDRSKIMPLIKTEWTAGHSVPASQQLAIFMGLFSIASIALLVQARREFAWRHRKKDLAKKLSQRMRKVHALLEKNEWRAVGVEVTNTSNFILGEIAGEGGADVELAKLFAKMPPSLRQELALPVSKLMDKFQALTFAPEEIVGSLKEKQNLVPLVDEFEKQMRKAISLASTSSETGAEIARA